jgi:uncharacterized membrane protein YfcA
MNYVLVGVLGLVTGVVSGLFGIGGGVLIVPALVLLVRLDQHTATGTSLGALLLPVGLLAVLEYHRRGQVHVPYAALLAVGLLVGALVGAKFAESCRAWYCGAGSVLLMLVSVKLLVNSGDPW